MAIKIKDKYKSTIIGFGTNGNPLGERTSEELYDLALMTRTATGNDDMLELFEEIPTLEELNKMKAKEIIATNSAVKTNDK